MTWLFRCSEQGGGLSGDHPGPQASPVRPRALFVQALALPAAGMIRLGGCWTGRSCGLTPPKPKATSYARMSEKEEALAARSRRGRRRRAQREPAWRRAARGIAASGTRLATIREAKAALTEEARQAARERTGTTADRRRGLRAVFQRGGRGRREASGIAATDVHTNAVDAGNLMPMTEQTAANTGQVLADSHYYSADNSDRAAEFAAEQGI